MNQSKPVHELCTEHSKLEQEIKDVKDDIRRFTKRLDYITYLLILICIETGISIPMMV